MQPRGWAGAGLAVLLLTAGVRAEGVLYTATVTAPEAEVRSGAGDNARLYPTNRLRQGDTVEVTRELGEWLAIKPPRGSFSWANTRNLYAVHPDQTLWTVHTRSAVLMGSTIRADKPTVEGARADPGTILRSIGQPRQADDGYWLPVEPPPTEVRYIRAAAVTRNKPGSPTPPAVVPVVPAATSPGAPASPFAPPTGVADAGVHPLWQKAQQAEQAGNIAEAIQLYTQLGQEVANTNHSLMVQAYSRANWLRERSRVAAPLPPPPQRTDVLYPAPVATPPAATPATPTPPPAPLPTPPPATPPAPVVPGAVGTLRPANQGVDGQKAYLLWNSRGQPVVFVVAGSGVNLDQHVNQVVEVVGPRVPHRELRADVLTATEVRAPR